MPRHHGVTIGKTIFDDEERAANDLVALFFVIKKLYVETKKQKKYRSYYFYKKNNHRQQAAQRVNSKVTKRKEIIMILIVCLDDASGMAFNGRRQSKDQAVRHRIQEITKDHPLWMTLYSAAQFDEKESHNINIDESCFNEAACGEYCFAETKDPAPWEKWIEKIIVFRWNRSYPSDVRMSIDLNGWTLEGIAEFKGSSHAKITEEVYVR